MHHRACIDREMRLRQLRVFLKLFITSGVLCNTMLWGFSFRVRVENPSHRPEFCGVSSRVFIPDMSVSIYKQHKHDVRNIMLQNICIRGDLLFVSFWLGNWYMRFVIISVAFYCWSSLVWTSDNYWLRSILGSIHIQLMFLFFFFVN